MKQLIIILVLIFSFGGKINSQTDSVYTGTKNSEPKSEKRKKNDDWKEKVTYGTNFQGYYYAGRFYIYLSPTIGYNLTKKLNVGVGVIYNYTSVDLGVYGKYSQSIFGGHTYARYFINESFYLQAQYDKLRQPDWYSSTSRKVWVDYAMVGAGYSQPLSDHLALNASLMYNLTFQRLSIYQSPFVFQIGISGRFK